MSSEPSQVEQMKPYLIVAGLLLIILLAVLFWPTADDTTAEQASDTMSSENAGAIITNDAANDNAVPEVFEAPPRPAEVVISPDMEVDEFDAQEIEVEIPVEIDDSIVKASLVAVASSPTFARLLVNDRLIEKFVINVNNLANAQLSPKDTLVSPPAEKFKTYQQANRTFIDNASFKRYNTYVDALESVDADELLAVFDNYKANITQKYAEISRPGQDFDTSLIQAIDTLLATPQAQMPMEVYTQSAMFKFKDAGLERLSGPQKQLLRTGPENMGRIKEVLRSVKASLEARQ